MKKKSKILFVLCLAVLFIGCTVIPIFASNATPGTGFWFPGVPLQDNAHYPQFNYDYHWMGKSQSTNTDWTNVYLGNAPVIYGNMSDFFDYGNGTNTLSQWGGSYSYIAKFLNAKSQEQNLVRWCNRAYNIAPGSFGITASNTITPPHGDNDSVVKFPIFDFIFNENGVIGEGTITLLVRFKYRLYTYDAVGEFVTQDQYSLTIPSTAFNRYVGGDVGYQEQQSFKIDFNDILISSLDDNGWDITQGIYWEYIEVLFSDVSIPGVVYDDYNADFVFYETLTYSTKYYVNEMKAYNHSVDTFKFNLGYVDGYTDGYYKGEQDGINSGYNDGYDEGFDEGYEEGYEEGETFLMFIPNFLEGVVEPFFTLEIFPNFSIGALLSILVGAFVVLWILKLIAGG